METSTEWSPEPLVSITQCWEKIQQLEVEIAVLTARADTAERELQAQFDHFINIFKLVLEIIDGPRSQP